MTTTSWLHLIDASELRTLLFAATAHEVPTDELNDTLIKVLRSHLELSQAHVDQSLSHQNYRYKLAQLVRKWREAKRWDGEPDIVTRAYAQEVERMMGHPHG